MPTARVLVLLAVSSLALGAVPDGSAVDPRVRYEPPVVAPIVDPFRPPPAPWAAGNRGIDYGTAPGTVVRAAAGGRVTFAGQVGGSLHVTVLHRDGVRTSYSFLGAVLVDVGQDVALGEPVARTGTAPLHFGARVGATYIDPTSLFAGSRRPRLVPLREPPAARHPVQPAWSGWGTHGYTRRSAADLLRPFR